MTELQDIDLKILTLNVRGIRSRKKRKTLLSWFKQQEKPDVIFLQETYVNEKLNRILSKEWTGLTYHSYTDSAHSRGVSILMKNKLQIEVTSKHTCVEGRKLLLNVVYKDIKFTFVNLYAPTNYTDRIGFINSAQRWISTNAHTDTNLIVCGDLNSVLAAKDRSSGLVERCTPYLQDFLKHSNLVDTWQSLNPNDTQYTFIDPSGNGSGSRIDFILVSHTLAHLATASYITTAPVPDHKAVITTIKYTDRPRGKGYWKLNNSLLEDQTFLENIELIFKATVEEYNDVACKRDIWDLCKIRFKEYSIRFSINKNRQFQDQLKSIERTINDLDKAIQNDSDNAQIKQTRKTLKTEYDNMCESRAKGAQIRSRAKWVEDGERSTAYFLKLENHRQSYSRITGLKKDKGETVTSEKEILKEACHFYKTLYDSNKNSSLEDINAYLNTVDIDSKLDNTSQTICEGLVTEEEATSVIEKLPKNKAPGLDGLTYEFYNKLWAVLGTYIIEVYNESFHMGCLSYTQKQSVLSLIYKKGDKDNISNYRPISLTNSDYKILAFILARRLQHVLPDIISSDQTAYIKGRHIGQNIRLIQDVIEHAKEEEREAALLFLDFKKAFDSVEHNFMYETLKAFNFGPEFIRWIKTMYTQTEACIKNNGYFSQTFNIDRGIKQGCPISALLFNLVVEILAIKLKKNTNIKGYNISVGNETREVKLSQYADDATVILKNKNMIPLTIQEISRFSEVAGPTLNIQKTKGMMLGPQRHRTEIIYNVSFENKPFKCLGIYVGHDKAECERLNWEDKIKAIERLLASWKRRDLTIFGKITIIKALAISKITHVAQNTTIPDNTIKHLNKILFGFIWGKKDRIRRKILCNDILNGGVGMIDIKSYFEALKATWINRLILHKHANWALFGYNAIQKHLCPLDLLLNMNFDTKSYFPAFKKLPLFYQETVLAYTHTRPDITQKGTPDRDEILDQILWGNQLLTIKGTRGGKYTLNYQSWIQCGLVYVKDIRFVYGEVDERYVYNKLVLKTNYLTEMYNVKSILRPFKTLINNHEPVNNANNNDAQIARPCIVKSKQYYKLLTEKTIEHPQSENKWKLLFQGHTTDLIFKDIYVRKIMKIKERKLAEFNYKILHMILACNSNLKKWNISTTDKCEICDIKEDIVHLLFICPHAQYIWTFVEQSLEINITEFDVICGKEREETTNYVITLIAFLIYKEWLICRDLNTNRRLFNRRSFLYSELSFRMAVCRKLEMNTVFDTLMKLKDNVLSI